MADIRTYDDRGKKRKKKRSNMQMAKKFARRRNHGTDLDTETYQYMVRILELMREDFPSVEEKLMFINNVYEQSVGHEVEYSKNQVGSRVLESLLKYASLETIQRFTDALSPSMRPISSDRFASHVLEKIIVVCADRGNKSKNVSETPNSKETKNVQDIVIDVKESEVKSYNDIVIKLSKYLINNIEEFVWDTYANHLLRTVVECLGGLIDTSDGQNRTKQMLNSIERREVIQEYKDFLIDACNRLYNWPQFLEFGRDELTSGLLQSILYSLKDIDKNLTNSFVKKITKECFTSNEDGKLSNIFDCESSIRLLEACLAVAKSKSFDHIYEEYFKGNLKSLCITQGTIFSVQKLLDHCESKETFEEIFEEIEALFSDILQAGYTGILVSVANASKRLQTKQGAYLTMIIKMLGCDTSEEKQYQIIKCISTLKKQNELESLKEDQIELPIHLHGSLIVQAVLNFNKPIKIVNSLLALNNEQLLNLISNPKGSRIVDAYMDSKYIGEKSRDKLAKKLQGCWAQLAQSTHGSRCLDKIWIWSHQKQRMFIMEELAAAGEILRASKSGKIISNKLNVPLFVRNKKDWTESQGKEEKMKALFADIIKKPIKQS